MLYVSDSVGVVVVWYCMVRVCIDILCSIVYGCYYDVWDAVVVHDVV